MRHLIIGVVLFAASVTACKSQEQPVRNFGLPPGGYIGQRGASADQASLRVQVSFQVQMPQVREAPISEQATTISNGHQALYDLVKHECDLLSTSFEGECRLSSLNLNNQSQNYGPSSAISFSATASFEVVPRPAAPVASPKP